ncbi:ABC transporter [Secundilactobacillus paracollinoides]|uniref:ABC transporter n=1 Tax=Secundilactobacillus paracollinoides TaxID=240427 RepID=A0A1B2IUI3_9LACO|nr:ABC transporter ATP-binding protein [Secundilactobacillus paracollinoides]ANZ59927.1 ABC transporter [Secundilactobacillus paracollinoides]ANZ63115.1 ABC transporter [Secundilactobacillus paracollinoides]ANZ65718.1 ABC transporter [Secundilactobacillus paracollinoides]
MLDIIDLGYWYSHPDDALFSNVNLNFEAGQSYAVVGESGSGKTTFLSLVAGLDTPKAGRIELNGKDIRKMGLTNYRKHSVSIVFQAYNLFNYMSPVNNVMTAMAITNSKHQGDKAYAKQLLGKLGLAEDQMGQNVTHLSGGQQQRVAIARAMACDADLVVADEPTGNLDEANTKDVVDLFQKLAHEENKCVIIVTHETSVAAACDHSFRLAHKQFTAEQPTA